MIDLLQRVRRLFTEHDRSEELYYAGAGIAIGAALGLIFGILLFDNLAIGTGVSVTLGLIFGVAIDAQRKARSSEQHD